MKNTMMRFAALVMVLVLLAGAMPFAQADSLQVPESESLFLNQNPLQYVETEDEFITILLCGLDFTTNKNYRGSGNKRDFNGAHTDANMVIAVNKTKGEVSLISLPRDTLCYIPGVRGIYKLNLAVNCAPTIQEGLKNTCAAASWLLGGIPIDYYAALDMDALVKLGNLMGGVTYDMDMTYKGHSGKKYNAGTIKLDGLGMLDYLRARKNATIRSGIDMARCDRNRQLMITVYEKFMNDPTHLIKLWDKATDGSLNFFTNVDDDTFTSLVQLMLTLGNDSVGSYLLDGELRICLKYWNFTLTYQENRQQVIKKVFGIDVPAHTQTSAKFIDWMEEYGIPGARQILIAKQILNYGYSLPELTSKQEKALDELKVQLDKTVEAYDAWVNDIKDSKLQSAFVKARLKLRDLGETASLRVRKYTDAKWNTSEYWYRDSFVLQYPELDWR